MFKTDFNIPDSYVIVQDLRDRTLCNKLYLVDRRKTKEHWWTDNIKLAITFPSRKLAEIQATKYKYNNIRVEKL